MAITLEGDRPANYLTRLATSDLGRSFKALILNELDIQPGATVLDLGCGPGADLSAIAEAVGGTGRVVGVDNDASAVSEAIRAASRLSQVEVTVGDAHSLDLPTDSVDRVHTDRVLQHVADPNAVVAEVARVLRPGGVVGFAEPDWDTLVIDYPDPAIPVAYRKFITDRVVRNSRIGRQLPAICEANGLVATRILPVTVALRDLAQADKIFGFERVTRRATEADYLTATQAAEWLEHLRTAPLFVSLSLFPTFAESMSAA
ncbi:MAG TPA: methyltransferase domain-containing protein [Actinophytocola sp.]|nr:methyltransferase domain-containing protein [Actinophytocola sp.]